MDKTQNSADEIAKFVHRYRETIRWGDMDSFGHVNNVQFFRYLEGARVAYSSEVVGSCLRAKGESVILADQRCSFLKQLNWPGKLDVYTRTARVGRTSFRLGQLVCRADGEEVVATGEGVMVWFDFDAQQPVPIPEALRRRVAEYERTRPEGL
ncbi:MAG: acyl-CoA thioesterase [Gammaproteobacteria bacterium]